MPWREGSRLGRRSRPRGAASRGTAQLVSCAVRPALCCLDVVDGDLTGAAAFRRIEGNLLVPDEATHSGPLESGGVDEDIFAAVVWLNKAEALHVV